MSFEETYILKEEHHYLLDKIEKLKGVLFLTGKAGTGKTTMLKIIQRLLDRNLIILAPTGIAAVQIKGQTIHSFFKIAPNLVSTQDYKKIPEKMLAKIDLIVIDEISMVRSDLLDHIDKILKISTRSSEAFGGIPMLWIGDLYQLPPVVNKEEREIFSKQYATPYFFGAMVFQQLKDFEMIELNQIFRQKDPYFIRLLNQIRNGDIDYEELEELNSILVKNNSQNEPEDLMITICATNATANAINIKRLHQIESEAVFYTAKVTGSVLATQYPTEQFITLKKGAQILFTRNDPAKRFVNGSLGIIEELKADSIVVVMEKSREQIEVQYMLWEIIKYTLDSSLDQIKTEVIGTFSQLPIKLGWAITIHKSQGQTFDRVNIDLGFGAFEKGQTYVAMSRCRTMEGIRLQNRLKFTDIQCDDAVIEFMRKFN